MKTQWSFASMPQRLAARRVVGCAVLAAAAALTACSALPQPPARQVLYDFGVPLQAAPKPAGAAVANSKAPLVLAPVKAVGVPDGSAAIVYRLAYADGRELRPYTQARWTVPVVQLVQQSLRAELSRHRAVMLDADGAMQALEQGASPAMLRIEVEEFSHVFTSATASVGLLRIRATLTEITEKGELWRAQQVFSVQTPAASADAAGGTAAMAASSDEAGRQLDAWLRQQGR